MPVAIRKRLSETLVEVHLMSQKYNANNIMIQRDGNWPDETHLIIHYGLTTEHQEAASIQVEVTLCFIPLIYIIIQTLRLLVRA